MLTGALVLISCQLAGEALARLFALPVPGPVVGMLLLLVGLVVRSATTGRPDPPAPVSRAGDALLRHLQLLYVPAGVGVVPYLGLVGRSWQPVLAGLVGSWALALVTTGLVAQGLLRRRDAGSAAGAAGAER